LPEWLVEQGIGETRVALVDEGEIVEARILRDGVVPAGTVLAARLVSAGRNAVARAGTQEYLLPRGAPVTEGAALNIEVTREALAGGEPWKRPLARATEAAPAVAPALAGRSIAFPGGELRVALTPAMTLIDVDGHLPPEQLALAGATASARTIRRHGIGGSIGIDLPTIGGKAARQAVAEAVDAILPQPFERTAVNGFGFLQIVRPRLHPSLFELAADRAAFEARALLRLAEREVGAVRLAAHPAVIAELNRHPEWLDQLSRKTGGLVTLRSDASLAMSAGHAERA
jgi:hypothetical protein